MSGSDWLAERFERNRGHLRAVAYRMLGSATEADDAVQETWLRLSRSDVSGVENLGGWLTTVAARVCLDMLRARSSRREEPLEEQAPESPAMAARKIDPEQEAVLADAVGAALLVVLDRLEPAERLAFVMHDMFAVPFEEIAPIVGRTADAARQLASRARRRVHGAAAGGSASTNANLPEQRRTVEGFIRALRAGDFEGLLAMLDPDVVVRIDAAAGRPGAGPREVHGARNWARGAIAFSRTVRLAFVEPALVDGVVGLVLARRGRLFRVLRFTFEQGKIAQVDILADPENLEKVEVRLLED